MITVKVETAALTTIKINDAMRGKYFMGALSLHGCAGMHNQLSPRKIKTASRDEYCKQPALQTTSNDSIFTCCAWDKIDFCFDISLNLGCFWVSLGFGGFFSYYYFFPNRQTERFLAVIREIQGVTIVSCLFLFAAACCCEILNCNQK